MNEMGVVWNITTGNLSFLGMKIIKIKKKVYRIDGEIRHFTRSASLSDSTGTYYCNLYYCVIRNGLD